MEAAGDRLIDDRNRALLAVAYDAMLRRAELVSLQVADLLKEVQGDGSLLVRRSKTDGEGRGEIAWVGPDTVRLVHAWLDRAGIGDGRLFCSVDKGGRVGDRLHPCQVPRIFKAMAREAHLPEAVVAGLSGHSSPGRRGPGHGRRRHRATGDPPRRSVEVDRDGEPLRRAVAGEA